MQNESKIFIPKVGQVVEFVAMDWKEDWDFGFPSVLLNPVTIINTNNLPGDALIAETLNKIMSSKQKTFRGEEFKKDFEKQLRKVVSNKFEGKNVWKNKSPRFYKFYVEFTINEESTMECNTLKKVIC